MDIQKNVSLKPYHTFGIDCKAEGLYVFRNIEDLRNLRVPSEWEDLPKIVLGGGSNMLFLQEKVPALFLKNEIRGQEIVFEDEQVVRVRFMGGNIWHDCVLWAVRKSLGGMENLSLIPGTAGAAPIQNIGAYGVELKDIFIELEAYEISGGNLRTFTKEECEFAYRESIFKHKEKGKYIIISITLELQKNPELSMSYGDIGKELSIKNILVPGPQDISDIVIDIRKRKLPDPGEIGNAGSFFKNPVISRHVFQELIKEYPEIPNYVVEEGMKIPAGWLIEKAGWKGFRKGDIGVHSRQALVLVNYGNARGRDIYALSEEIIDSIYKKFKIKLHREVRIINILGT